MEGYKEAKRILEENCGREIKVHKKLIMELENLRETMNTNQIKEYMNLQQAVVSEHWLPWRKSTQLKRMYIQ